MAQVQDIPPIYRGEDVTLNFRMVPVEDITGWTMSFRLKQLIDDATVLLTVNASITTPAAGTFAVALSAAQTTTVAAGYYAYDVWRTDSGSAAALALGTVVVKGSVRLP
jgi:hypothetical protein